MGEVVDFAGWFGAGHTEAGQLGVGPLGANSAALGGRTVGDDEVDRLYALSNVAKVLAQLVAAGEVAGRDVPVETIDLGNEIVRALARLDLVSQADDDGLELRLRQVRRIRALLQAWRSAIGIR